MDIQEKPVVLLGCMRYTLMVMEQISGMDLGCAISSKMDMGQAIEAIITQLSSQAGVMVCLIRCDGAPEFITLNS